MEMTAVEIEQTDLNHPQPEKYVHCPTCGAVIGYQAHIGLVLYLFVFAYPIRGVRHDMADRRLSSRLLDGDYLCGICCTWSPWLPEGPWQTKKAPI